MPPALLSRPRLAADLAAALRRHPVVALLGPRQSGKTTAARTLLPSSSPNYFDLEDPTSLARLDEPLTALRDLRGLVVIDEVQRHPELFPVLRVLADRRPIRARFLILGSASGELLRQSSESLAGRLETIHLAGLRLEEVGAGALEKHWRRGGFPAAFTPRAEEDSLRWRAAFVQTIVERDIPALGSRLPATSLLRFWRMVAHYHGGIWNSAEPARALGLSQPTVRQYLDLFTDLFFVRQLAPWHENLLKRQVKSPKVYIRDSGVLHTLLGIRTADDLLVHPRLGASWEGYAVEEVLKLVEPEESYFWATHGGAELDLLLFKGGRRWGVEVKRQDAPALTPSIRTAMTDLGLEHVAVVYPGSIRYPISAGVTAVPFASLVEWGPDTLMPKRRRSWRG